VGIVVPSNTKTNHSLALQLMYFVGLAIWWHANTLSLFGGHQDVNRSDDGMIERVLADPVIPRSNFPFRDSHVL